MANLKLESSSSPSGVLYRGKPLESYTKEQLINIIARLESRYTRMCGQHIADMNTLMELTKRS